ncbi:hypothetical protein FEM48_Zijuj10G0094300 [Ziziphus jujuba var. spinosa]|uniref:Uncharacterized protein n=1 Tax=Ziziphus jujuba var. spinosa TaxID=714518 RepID=A0A978UMK4_ZIZJJ|nr:hypothetical protein FEM48_Zijuj10G0094300 [Ziziphus jujuba var. spinosa]
MIWEAMELKRRREKEREASRAALLRLERIIEFESREEIELRRKREREASRMALDQLEKSVVFEDNLQIEMEIRNMCRASPYYHVFGRNPLNGLGLFLKRDDEEVIIDHTTNEPKSFGGQIINGSADQTSSSTQLSPRKAARVSMLKSRFMDVISKSQQQLGLLDRGIQDLNKQKQPMINSRRCCIKTKATIQAPIGSATIA